MNPFRLTSLLLPALFFSITHSSVWAAPQPGKKTEFVDQFNNRFLQKPPPLDKQILDGLKAFDEQGNEFDFEKLKGKHTVIVFGCLT